jgi:hypothetical protein
VVTTVTAGAGAEAERDPFRDGASPIPAPPLPFGLTLQSGDGKRLGRMQFVRDAVKFDHFTSLEIVASHDDPLDLVLGEAVLRPVIELGGAR